MKLLEAGRAGPGDGAAPLLPRGSFTLASPLSLRLRGRRRGSASRWPPPASSWRSWWWRAPGPGASRTALLGTVVLLYIFIKLVYLPFPKGDGPFERLTLSLYRALGIF